jgi:hypothetical protein
MERRFLMPKPKLPANKSWIKPITFPITLNASEWCELANAVAGKAAAVRLGNYGGRDPIDGFDPDAWAVELEGIYDKLSKVLEKNAIPF